MRTSGCALQKNINTGQLSLKLNKWDFAYTHAEGRCI